MELLLILAGMFLGIAIAAAIYRAYFVGTLRIDHSDPEDGPYMFLELDKGVSDISSKKHVILKVKLENFIPHK
jgi:hypothetical protein|nr:MAG TPA: hypothetical protein [Caudoviricetes sp.]